MECMEDRYADIIVDITQASMDRTFQYRIPERLWADVQAGCAVRIPFGNGKREVSGYVLSVGTKPKIEPEKIKDILDVLPDRVTAEARLIRLALWMKSTYGSSLNNALKTVLPVRDKERPVSRERIALAVDQEMAGQLLEEYQRKHYRARERLIGYLLEHPSADRAEVVRETGISGDGLKKLEAQGIISREKISDWRMPEDLQGEAPMEEAPALSVEQEDVLFGIMREWEEEDRPCVIRGVTGSGKTLIYLELADRILKEGRQAIILIPEIALSWQTVQRFRKRFGDTVTVLNSRMSKGERSDQYERMRTGEVRIVIGPRSALFTPFPDPGLIIIDEEQEQAYRSESAPRYDAREAALARGRMEKIHVVFGSATPSLDTWYRCSREEYALFTLKNRAGHAALPSVLITDMREELKSGNRSILGRALQDRIAARLAKGEQTILFLNRRGYNGFISCRSCGYVVKCPHCDVSMTLHANGRMICHYCGTEIRQMKRCPECGSPYIGGFFAGTEKVEEELARLYPGARVLRMDADTTKGKNDHSRILKSFAAGEADILVGTQMIVKGHDFPHVTLTGILAADQSLFASDYRAAERTFQLLVQAIGRSGRGQEPGEAVIQTYHPEHYSIRAAAAQDYEAFCEEEIAAREMLDYPPAADLLAIHGQGPDEQKLDLAMHALQSFLEGRKSSTAVIIGPAPETVKKIQDVYRQVLYIKDTDRQSLIAARRLAEKYIEINSGFNRMFFQYDLNA